MEQIDQATPVTRAQLRRMRPTYWIINKYHFGGVIAAFLQIFIRYGHREYLSTLFYILLVMAIPSALAVEFNLNVLDKSMRDRIDISLLKGKGALLPVNILLALQ